MAKYLLDTNVVLRGVNRADAGHSLVVEAVARLIETGHEPLVSAQVIIEFWSVATRPADANGLGWGSRFVTEEVHRLLDQVELLPETPAVFQHWFRLCDSLAIAGKRVHDARLAAVMLAAEVEHILTFNTRDFAGFPGIVAVTPHSVVTASADGQ